MSRLGISFVLLFFFLMPSQSANAEKEQMPSGSAFSQLVVGSIVTTFINSEEGKMLVTFDRRTGTFTSLTADFLSENEEQEQFRILKAVRVNEVAATKPTKWNYGKWKNYKITIEEKATVAIITTAILGLIPYVGKLAAPVAALVITWKLKTGYFSAKKDFRFAGSYMLEKQHLKIWKKSNYTQLREYKTADEKIWIAWGGEVS